MPRRKRLARAEQWSEVEERPQQIFPRIQDVNIRSPKAAHCRLPFALRPGVGGKEQRLFLASSTQLLNLRPPSPFPFPPLPEVPTPTPRSARLPRPGVGPSLPTPVGGEEVQNRLAAASSAKRSGS